MEGGRSIAAALVVASLALAGCASTGAPSSTGARGPSTSPTDSAPTPTPTDTAPTNSGTPGTSSPTDCGQDSNDSPPCNPYEPPSDFCDSHNCIANYANGTGYVVECNDGTWSHSGGKSGACSDHGGESSGSADAGTSPSSGGNQPEYTRCDANISAKADTTDCDFAENTFYEYWAHQGDPSISVYSPQTGTSFTVQCSSTGGQVDCSTDQGGDVQFSQSAVDAYTSSQAADYAATHKLAP